MNYMEDSIDWQAVEYIDTFLDRNVGRRYQLEPFAQDWARIAKIMEEGGEAVAAFIGATQQNPRKGNTHEMNDVLIELADTVLTALYALQHFTKNSAVTASIVKERIATHERRFQDIERAGIETL